MYLLSAKLGFRPNQSEAKYSCLLCYVSLYGSPFHAKRRKKESLGTTVGNKEVLGRVQRNGANLFPQQANQSTQI